MRFPSCRTQRMQCNGRTACNAIKKPKYATHVREKCNACKENWFYPRVCCFFLAFFMCVHCSFLPRDAMHKRSLCRHAVSVCVSVTFVHCIKTHKDIRYLQFFIHRRVATTFSFFRTKQDANTPIHCRASVVCCSHKTTTKCLWRAGVICRRWREVKPPLGQPPFSAVVGHRRAETSGYFCWKLTLTRTPDPIRPTGCGPDPNRPMNGSKQGGYDLGGVCPGGEVWSDTATCWSVLQDLRLMRCVLGTDLLTEAALFAIAESLF